MGNLQEKIRQVEDEHAEEQLEKHLEHHAVTNRDRALLIIGGFKTALKISTAINSEVMRSLETFQEQRLYSSFGYERFADFLDEYEHSPMTKNQYYERKAILDREGDAMFDLLSDMGMSIRKRKLLGKGNVEFDGEKVIVHDGDEQTEIEITDRTRLLETLTALADANADKSSKLEKQKTKLDKHDEEKRELCDEIDRVKAEKKIELGGDPHSIALANACFALTALREESALLSDTDRAARGPNVMETLASQMQQTAAAYETGDWTAHVRTASDSDRVPKKGLANTDFDWDTAIDNAASGDDNDAELAASM
jgi:hypothetical protein